MRLVQVMVPTGKREAVLGVLDEEDVDYALSDETSGRDYTAVVTFPLPTSAVEPILDRLREVGIERNAYTVVIQAETVVSERFEALEGRYDSDDEDPGNGTRIAREELVARASEMAPTVRPYVLMTALSAIVATAGLLLDSPAVVVGSMVIAPLIGPAMAASAGTVVDDADLALRGIKLQALGGVVAIGAAAAFALLIRTTNVVPLSAAEVFAIGEVRERLAPGVLSLVIALGAGAAGAVSLASGVSSALVGVMIAAALVPPTAVVGIGIAWGEPATVLGSGVLVLVNVLAINLVALVVLWRYGYRPRLWFREDEARATTIKRVAALAIVLLLLTGLLGAFTYSSYRTADFESEATAAIEAELPPESTVIDLSVTYEGFPLQTPRLVVVTVGYPPSSSPPAAGNGIRERVAAVAPDPIGPVGHEDIRVEIRYVGVDRPPE
ncbi:TIGR00341 family protein [Halobellus salinus]|uniref:TIGR00341 family protein n=1 Tax=Halobellus salinus TaxID=931585 RepID=A0A830ECJ5_9EURY|nr:TIGR00341 family protein [Halobellus salinus]GGJ12143.1 TIGR00341 family protein [Halobellus salinus]